MRIKFDSQLLSYKQAVWYAERKRLLRVIRQVRNRLISSDGGKCHFSRSTLHVLRRLRRERDYLPDSFFLERLANLCLDRGWAGWASELYEATAYVRSWKQERPKPSIPPPALDWCQFLPDDMEPDEEDILMQDPERQANEAMIAHIRLNRDPEEVSLSAPGGEFDRRDLRSDLRDLRDALGVLQPDMAQSCGLSVRTLNRLENLERKGSYLPHRSTLLKLASLCRERGWEGRALTLEKAAGWERWHKYPEGRFSRGRGGKGID